MIKLRLMKEYENISENVLVINDMTIPVYVVKGERNFLIDTSVAGKAPKIKKRIEEMGITIDTILLTHAHYDHVGGATYLQNHWGCNVVGSRHGIGRIQDPDQIEYLNMMNRKGQEKAGIEDPIEFGLLKELSTVSEGDRIEVGPNRYFEVLETPGHSLCSLAYLLKPDNILFPGDATGVREGRQLFRPLFFTSYTDYRNSLLKLQSQNPDILALSHNRYLKGKKRIQEYFSLALNAAEKLSNIMVAKLGEGKDYPQVAEEIFSEVFYPQSTLPSFMGSKEFFVKHLTTMVKAAEK